MTSTVRRSLSRRATAERGAGLVLRGLGALFALVALVVGVPTLLVILAPVGLPSRGPTWDELVGAWTRPDDGSVVWGIMTAVAWVCWLIFVVQVGAALAVRARAFEMPGIRGFGWMQRGATTLVTAALLFVTMSGPGLVGFGPERVAAAAEQHPDGFRADGEAPNASANAGRADGGVATLASEPASHAAASDPGTDVVDGHPVIAVLPGDTLWDIAERHLGSGKRYVEIVALNLGRVQGDGLSLTDEHWIEPGWVLRLPMDAADVPSETPPSEPAAATAESVEASAVHTVVPGDSLWDIAAAYLNDGTRYTEIFDLNVGVGQPDGDRLIDPDLIRPGWHLALPVLAAQPVSAPSASPDPAPSTVLDEPRHSADLSLRAVAPPPMLDAPSDTAPDVISEAAPADGDELADLDAGPRVSTTLVAGMAALAAALVLAELDRRRRRQRRLRRAGERVALPPEGSEARRVESELRNAAPALTLPNLDAAMCRLAAACLELGRPLPRIEVVLVGAEHVDLLLAGEDPDAIPPFAPLGPRRWRASTGELVAPRQYEAEGDVATPFPVLVSVGQHGAEMVLVNLEAAGTLSIMGDPDVARGALRALACELGCRPMVGSVPPFVTDELSDLAGFGRPDIAMPAPADPEAHAPVLAAYEQACAALGVDDILSARRSPGPAEGWLPIVHVGSPPPATRSAPWGGLVTVAVGEHGGWHLVVDPDGTGRLDPIGIDLAVSHLDDSDYRGLLGALHTAREEPSRPPATTAPSPDDELEAIRGALSEELEGPVDAGPTDAVGGSEAGEPASERSVRVLVLGRPTVVGHLGGVELKRERRLTEIVAFLAFHPGASVEALDGVLGGGQRVTASSRNSYISRARSWLGPAPDGTLYLPALTARDDYRLHPSVRTDWDEFRDLLRAGVQGGPSGAESLRAALALVRGRPFADVLVGTYDWAEPLIHQMIDQIVDAAHLYAVQVGDSDYHSVREALAIALTVDPVSELLHRDAIVAANRAGDTDEVDRLTERLQHRIAEIDPDDGMEEETIELLERVRRRSRSAAGRGASVHSSLAVHPAQQGKATRAPYDAT